MRRHLPCGLRDATSQSEAASVSLVAALRYAHTGFAVRMHDCVFGCSLPSLFLWSRGSGWLVARHAVEGRVRHETLCAFRFRFRVRVDQRAVGREGPFLNGKTLAHMLQLAPDAARAVPNNSARPRRVRRDPRIRLGFIYRYSRYTVYSRVVSLPLPAPRVVWLSCRLRWGVGASAGSRPGWTKSCRFHTSVSSRASSFARTQIIVHPGAARRSPASGQSSLANCSVDGPNRVVQPLRAPGRLDRLLKSRESLRKRGAQLKAQLEPGTLP